MNIFRSRLLLVAGLAGTAGLLVNVNCGGGSSGGTGGTTGTGGTQGATGGKTGTGGSGTGGTTSTGGAGGHATGGAGGAATGGNGGANGGNGGSSTTDGGVQQFAAISYLFPTDLEGFALNNFGTGNLDNVDGGTKPTLTFDNGVGKPDAGSAKVEATFTDYDQFALATVNIAPLIDATGKTLSAWVMVDAVDGGPSFNGYAQLQVNSTSAFHGANSAGVGLTPGVWKQITLDLTTQAAPFDASQIIQVSMKFATGDKGDAGPFGAPQTWTFHFDSITDGSGLPAAPALEATFDHSAQGFSAGVFGTVPDGGAGPSATFDSTTGDPNPGSLEVSLPFTAYGQGYAVDSSVAPPANLSGKVIHAKVMLDKTDAGESSFAQVGYVKVFAQGTGFVYASGNAKGLTAGVWTDLTMTVSTPEGGTPPSTYDPTKIVQVGVQFGTGGMPDGGVFGALETPHFHIDSIVAQ